MGIRIPWPLRRQPASAKAGEAAQGAPSRRAPSAGQRAPAIDVDAGFAAAFRARGAERDATPLLGPWGGLADTARVAVSASRFQDTLVTQRFSDEVRPREVDPSASSGAFIASLASLASYGDPTGAPGESGSPFADSLPASRGDLVAPTAPATSAPASPALRPVAFTRRGDHATIGRTPDRRPATSGASARPSERPRTGTATQRTVDGTAPAVRPRSVVTESGSSLAAPPSTVTQASARSPIPVEPGPSSAAANQTDIPLPLAPPLLPEERAPSVLRATGTAAPRAGPPTPASRAVDPSPTRSQPQGDGPRLASEAPIARSFDEHPSLAAPSAPPELPLAQGAPPTSLGGAPPEGPLPLGALEPSAIARAIDAASLDSLPLAEGAGSTDSPAPAPAAAIPPGDLERSAVARSVEADSPDSLPLVSEYGPRGSGERRSAAPTARGEASQPGTPPIAAELPLLQRESAPPIPSEPGISLLQGRAASPALTPRVRRFRVGEPQPADGPLARALPALEDSAETRGDGRSSASATRPMSASVGTALPIARATLVAPVAGHRDDDLQGDGPLPTPPLTPTSVPGMPLATSLAPDLRDPLESLASPRPLPRSNTPAHQDVRRSIEISDVPRSSPLLLFRDSAPAPLPVESIAAPARGRAPGNRASSGLDETPAFFAPAPVDLPLATGAVTAHAGGTSASSGTGSPGLQRLAVNGQSLGAAPRPANIVWRAPDSEPISEAPTEAAPAQAVGQITATAGQKPAEPDLDKLTEKVWQRIRRTLQLERERQKGLP